MQEDKQFLSKIANGFRFLAVIILFLNYYYYFNGFFADHGWAPALVDRVVVKMANGSILFITPFVSLGFCFVLLCLSAMGTKGKKDLEKSVKRTLLYFLGGAALFFASAIFIYGNYSVALRFFLYIMTSGTGFFCIIKGGNYLSRLLSTNLMKDVFNEENESFQQEENIMENEYSFNLPTQYQYKGKIKNGWINVVNPFRASMVLGTPGSGKSFAIIIAAIKQQIAKGYSMYVYDFKFDDLSKIVYNTVIRNMDKYPIAPKFYVINFDDVQKSHRCNPLLPELMTDIIDAYESAYTIMLNLNKSWIQKQGDFFVESPINLLTAIIWFLKIYEEGKYCTFPHAIEFLNQPYEKIFPIMGSYPELENYVSPFVSAFQNEAMEQLEGQIASAKIPLSRIVSPQLYWVMSGNDFTLDLNNPNEPKILCVGNNPERQAIYGAALGLYNARIVKLVNKKKRLKMSIVIDELPTIYFKGLDTLIATARSNKVSTILGFQDFSQLERDYGKAEATVIRNTVGNVFSGQVVSDSAKILMERFGKILQQRQSMTMTREDTTTSISTQMDYMIPQSKISNLSQGMFVGAVADNFGEDIKQKVFHAQILVDVDALKKEEASYVDIPIIKQFSSDEEMKIVLNKNFIRIKEDIKLIIKKESERLGLEEKK